MSAIVLRTFALFAAAAILSCHLLAVHGLAARPLHYDENEAMHASWLMAAGKRIYRDFFEDHPPHLGLMLHSVLPEGDLRRIDVQLWTIRARQLSGAFGAIAVGAVMLFAWRMTRSPAAPIVVAATLLGSSQIWARGLADIRAEAPTLALFWVGVVLLTWNRAPALAQALRAGAGIGLMFFAAVWNPKWPLESVLMGALYLHFLWTLRSRPRLLVAAIAPALVIAAIAVLPLFTVTTVRDFLFFNFRFKSAVVRDFAANAWIVDFFERVPVWQSAAAQHRWYWIVAALALAILAMRVWKPAERRLAWIAMALCASALLELRFVYPYPYLWAQYLVMVATTASLVYAMLAAALENLASRVPSEPRLGFVAGAVVLSLATMFTLARLREKTLSAFRKPPAAWTSYWNAQRTLQTSLGPTDTVWISPPRHPVAAFDASYYWYNFRESAPSAIRAHAKFPQFLPTIGFMDLPPCQVLRDGTTPHPALRLASLAQGHPLPARRGERGNDLALRQIGYPSPLVRGEGQPIAVLAEIQPRYPSPRDERGEGGRRPDEGSRHSRSVSHDIKYLELGDWMPFLDGVCRCAERAFNAGLLTPADSLGIFEVGADHPPSPSGEVWMRRTRWLWSDMCRRQQVFLEGGQLNITP